MLVHPKWPNQRSALAAIGAKAKIVVSVDAASGGMIALIVILGVAVLGMGAGVAFNISKEKAGEPLFMDTTTKTPLAPMDPSDIKVENA